MTAEANRAGRSRAAAFHPRKLYGPFTWLFARGFFASIALQVLTVMALVEAIFLAERFPMVFRDVLKNNADLFDTALLFFCNSSQIFDLALALSVLMAVYWTTLYMRENRELLVMFAAGTGPYQLAVLALAVAMAAQIASLTVSGLIDPASRYFQRVVLFRAEFRVLKTGINTGQFYFFPNRVAFAPAQAAPKGSQQTRRLFVFQQDKPGSFRVITADHASLDGPDASGNVLVRLGGFSSKLFSDVPSLVAKVAGTLPSKEVRRTTLSASDVEQQMTMDELLTFLPRGKNPEELTVFEQLRGPGAPDSEKRQDAMRLLGERFARSLLCLLAPLIAMASVCLTTRVTNYFVLPLACMMLMALNMTSGWLIRTIAPVEPWQALAVPAAVTMVFAAALFATVIRRQGLLVRPALGRP